VTGAVVAVVVADGIADVGSVAVGSAATSPLFGIPMSAFVFGAFVLPSLGGVLSLVQPWMSRPPMKTTCTIKIVKKAMRMVDLFFEGDVPCGTNGLGVFIFCPIWFMSFVEVFVFFLLYLLFPHKERIQKCLGSKPSHFSATFLQKSSFSSKLRLIFGFSSANQNLHLVGFLTPLHYSLGAPTMCRFQVTKRP
jgi:hypothetical protein